MLERDYQALLIKELRIKFPGCVILKNDSDYMPGVPDLLILHKNKWAMLEVKADEDSPNQPNQEYYVFELDRMSYASFIYPANHDAVLVDLKDHFRTAR